MQIDMVPAGLKVELDDPEETRQLGQALAKVIQAGDILALIGPLGSGKTALSRAIAESLGVESECVSSPTFTLIHEYVGTRILYHIDTYRLRSADLFDDLGVDDLWADREAITLIEWADRVEDRIPRDRTWKIQIVPTGDRKRRIIVETPNEDLDRLAKLHRDLDTREH